MKKVAPCENRSLSPEWRKEIARRCSEIDAGMVDLIPAEEVFARAYESLEIERSISIPKELTL